MKKNRNIFKTFLIISFIIFIGLYIASESGFYESKLRNEVALTDKAIYEFEQDVLNGEAVDLNTYLTKDYVDYSNSFTSLGEKLSDALIKLITEGVSGIWDAIKVLLS